MNAWQNNHNSLLIQYKDKFKEYIKFLTIDKSGKFEIFVYHNLFVNKEILYNN
jgi:hypothetical protein